MVLLQSREDGAQSPDADKARSSKQYLTSQTRRSTSDEDSLDLDIPSSSRGEGKKSPILNKVQFCKVDTNNKKSSKSPEPSTSFADEDGIGLSVKRISRRKASAEVEVEAYKDDAGDSSPDEVMFKGGSRDAGDDDEREPPGTRVSRIMGIVIIGQIQACRFQLFKTLTRMLSS